MLDVLVCCVCTYLAEVLKIKGLYEGDACNLEVREVHRRIR